MIVKQISHGRQFVGIKFIANGEYVPHVEEDSNCPCFGCKGTMAWEQYTCYCRHTYPPCSNCENAWLACNECGWVEEDDVI